MVIHRHIPETNDRNGIIVMAVLLSLSSVSAVVARIYARRLSSIPLMMDDWLSVASLVLVLALNAVFLAATIQGAITGHSAVVDDWPVTSELEHLAEKYKYAFQILEKPTFGLIKMSIIFLWKRIFAPVRSLQIACWVMIGITIAWSAAFFFGTIFQCGTAWDLNWAPMIVFTTQCSNTLEMTNAFSVTDVVTDIIIIIIPIPLIWRLQMSKGRKIGVTAVFLVGIFTVGAGVARMYLYLGTSEDIEDNPDFIADFTNFILWSEIEANIAIMCSCMPTMIPVLKKMRSMVLKFSWRNLLPRQSPSRCSEKSCWSKTDSFTQLTHGCGVRPQSGVRQAAESQRIIPSGAVDRFDIESQNPDLITETWEFNFSFERSRNISGRKDDD